MLSIKEYWMNALRKQQIIILSKFDVKTLKKAIFQLENSYNFNS